MSNDGVLRIKQTKMATSNQKKAVYIIEKKDELVNLTFTEQIDGIKDSGKQRVIYLKGYCK